MDSTAKCTPRGKTIWLGVGWWRRFSVFRCNGSGLLSKVAAVSRFKSSESFVLFVNYHNMPPSKSIGSGTIGQRRNKYSSLHTDVM